MREWLRSLAKVIGIPILSLILFFLGKDKQGKE